MVAATVFDRGADEVEEAVRALEAAHLAEGQARLAVAAAQRLRGQCCLMVTHSEMGTFGPACWQYARPCEQAFWLGGSSRERKRAGKLESSCEEGVAASCGPAKTGILAMLAAPPAPARGWPA